MEHTSDCKKCGHFMIEHGTFENKGYCARGPDCKCTIKGKTYEEALADL